jgi:hypothetical protein
MQKRLKTRPITIVEFCLEYETLYKEEENVRWHISLDFKYGLWKWKLLRKYYQI